MKVLVIGSGGREHALVWKISQSPFASRIFCAPGNPGTSQEPKCQNVSIDPTSIVSWSIQNKIDLVVIGPEAPLAAGLADRLRANNIPVFGPGASGARIESSKGWAKELMGAAYVPTASARSFSDFATFGAHVARLPEADFPVVVKFDGLAAGKGVVVARNVDDALAAGSAMLVQRDFGPGPILLEEFLPGRELSALAITDGRDYRLLETAQDYKRLLDGDKGPNTGGMGAISPAPAAFTELMNRVRVAVFDRTLRVMREQGIPYHGCLYAGLMAHENMPSVVEFNCRFGDPETQVILVRLKSDILLALLMAATGGNWQDVAELRWDRRPAVCVVLAAEGYPASPRMGDIITGLQDAADVPNVHIFEAGTAIQNGKRVTAGGRVLSVTALGDNVDDARETAYSAVGCIHFNGMQFRTDIGL